MAIEREKAFEIIYALAACEGRDGALFGNGAEAAYEAFARGLCGDTFPELWFELPLMGDPWFDVHMLVSRKDLHGGEAYAGLGDTYSDALAWFTGSKDTRQLALSFDSSTGDACHPAVQLLLDTKSMAAAQGFLHAVGRADLTDAYHSFVIHMSREWYACYIGVFPSRSGADWVRIECIVGETAQRAFANDPEQLRAQLARVGISSMDEAMLAHVSELARSPFPLEFQFDVARDGHPLPKLGASVRFRPQDWIEPSARAAVEKLFSKAEEWGLADGRWRRLRETAFAKQVTLEKDAASLWCFPAFLKIRWRDGQGLDAKSYLMAGLRRPSCNT